jgi:hypothetical protein
MRETEILSFYDRISFQFQYPKISPKSQNFQKKKRKIQKQTRKFNSNSTEIYSKKKLNEISLILLFA